MKLKQILCIALALTLALAIFAGCSKSDNPATAAPNNSTAGPGNRVVDTNKPVNTPSGNSGSDTRKVTPEPSDSAEPSQLPDSAEPATDDASQIPGESATPEVTAGATDAGSGN